MSSRFVPLLVVLLPACVALPDPAPDWQLSSQAHATVADLVASYGQPVDISIWLGAPGQPPLMVRNADEARAVASAIKPVLLLEWFEKHVGALDSAPPGLSVILADDRHPALACFTADIRREIRARFADSTVRDLGQVMIRGTNVSNALYNAAANLVIATLGGPSSVSAGIHQRRPDLNPLWVRRYMRNPREEGDNEASASALARVLEWMTESSNQAYSATTRAAARQVMLLRQQDRELAFGKTGALDSVPICRVRSGWIERDGKCLVSVVIGNQRDVPPELCASAGQRLQQLVTQIETLLLSTSQRSPARAQP